MFRYSLVVAIPLILPSLSSAEIVRDGSLGTNATPISGPNYAIQPDHGTLSGRNLFHSFDKFSIGTGESATFISRADVANIISRVTGGNPSSIDGQIRSLLDDGVSYSSANIFLLNPSGVMFGPNASLDIGGSFHVSTADYLRFDNGDRFYVHPAGTDVLSVAEPAAFGFLNSAPSAITGDKSYLRVPEGKVLSIIGGDITYQGIPLSTDANSPDFVLYAYGMLTAPNGRINLASLASAGEVALSDLSTGSARLGKISFTDGVKLDVTNQDANWNPLSSGGTVVIRGGEMLFRDGGIDAYGNPGGLVDIKGGSLHLDNFYLWPANFNWNFDATYADQSHPGTAIRIDLAGDMLMSHSSFIDSQNVGAGKGGDISVNASNVTLGDAVLDQKSWTGSSLGYYGYIGTTTINSGASGNIDITARNGLTIQNGFFVKTVTLADGNGGNVRVDADNLLIRDKGNLSVEALGSGLGGNLDVTVHTATFSAANDSNVENSFASSGIDALTAFNSDGGRVRVTADSLRLIDGGVIATALLGQTENGYYAVGRGANVEVNAKNVSISGYVGLSYLSGIDARVVGADSTGTGGNVTVTADTLAIENAGAIRSGLFNDAPGNAGNITINAKAVQIGSRGQIYADSFRGTGNSGTITVNADSMTITGAKHIPHPAELDSTIDFTGLSTTTNAGVGGNIKVTLTSGDLTLKEGGGIKADTQGTGLGGTIDVAARNILLDFGSINASSAGSGNAGGVAVNATSLSVGNSGLISTSTSQAGAGGVVDITSGALALTDSGKITTSSTGTGNAGKIMVTLSGELSATGSGAITADTAGAGQGGSIVVNAGRVTLTDRGNLTAVSTSTGDAGDVTVTADSVRIAEKGSISTRSDGTGTGGTITIGTGLLQMESGGQISSSSARSGNAGDIAITATDSVYVRNSSITTEALLADGGNITIKAPNTIRFDNSTLTASVNGEKETIGGNIIIDPQFVLLKGSDLVATAHKGTGGNIDITSSVFLADDNSLVSAASELGFPGTVSINAPNTVSGLVAPLSSDFVNSAALLRERCIARIREGKYSSFIVGGRDGIPIEPGNMIPGIMQ
jgi:filamentous hemagglutinin family protein